MKPGQFIERRKVIMFTNSKSNDQDNSWVMVVFVFIVLAVIEQNGIAGTIKKVTTEVKTANTSVVSVDNKLIFPIEKGYKYTNTFGDPRTYGGERKHKGTDIMCKKGTPIKAIESGTIVKIGWNNLGGWRITIKSKTHQWYYAHMSKYAKGMKVNTKIKSGQIIGYVGNSGYGPKGTTGKFDPHLHLQTWNIVDGKLKLINSYYVLKKIDRKV